VNEPAPVSSPQDAASLLVRFRSWLAWAIGLAALGYVAVTLHAGFREVGAELTRFSWPLYAGVLVLTVLNYALRFWKWHFLLGRLGVRVPVAENTAIFGAGFAMVISPARAGEVIKPWLVRARTGTPMATTVPALVTERLTDGLALLSLAAISVGRYAGDKQLYVWGPLGLVAVGLAVLASRRAMDACLALAERVPGVGRAVPKVREMVTAMRTCVSPGSLALTFLASVLAWGAECVGYQLVFAGFGAEVPLEKATFLYAFATVAGGAMPGGLGVADGALVGGAVQLAGVSEPVAVAAALLIRVATLWFGVVLGALALVPVGRMLARAPVTPG
jgi:uncharacterized membrane protein YbhN (UPF0104 family)